MNLCHSEFLDAPGEHLNSFETALVFENRDLSTTLAALTYERDLAYCRLITAEMAATFKDSDHRVATAVQRRPPASRGVKDAP